MSAGIYNILIEQGATFRKTIAYKDSTGAPIDLTAVSSIVGQVRPTAADPTEVPFTLSVEVPATAGLILWQMAASVTSVLAAPFKQVYDIDINWNNGDVTRLLQGAVTISPEVTR